MVAPVIYLFYNGANALKIFDSHSLVIQEVTPRGPMLYSVQFVSLMFYFMYMITFSTYYVKIMCVRPTIGEDEPLDLRDDDMPCYTISVWPFRFAGISTCLQVPALLLQVDDIYFRVTGSLSKKSRVWQDRYMVVVSIALLLIT